MYLFISKCNKTRIKERINIISDYALWLNINVKFSIFNFKTDLSKQLIIAFLHKNIDNNYETDYQEINENGIVMKTVSKGNLSSAISKSISNPLIFNENVKQMKYFDPGSDRVAATPIFDAIQHFKPTKVIAINVTSESAIYFEIKNVEVIEIMVNAVDSSENEVRDFSQLIEKNYNIGYNTVIKFLEE